MKLLIINGPNLNMLGIREPQIYGSVSYDQLIKNINDYASSQGITVDTRQSNHEGTLVDWIQEAYYQKFDGIVINPGAYTHTSIALADAIKAIQPIPVVEVHVSKIDEREEFRKLSYSAPYCIAQIQGEGLDGYIHAIQLISEHLKK